MEMVWKWQKGKEGIKKMAIKRGIRLFAILKQRLTWHFREKEKNEVRDAKVLKILESKDLQIQQFERVRLRLQ